MPRMTAAQRREAAAQAAAQAAEDQRIGHELIEEYYSGEVAKARVVVAEAAAALRRTERALQEWRQSGRIPFDGDRLGAVLWVSLYASGKFTQAAHAAINDRADRALHAAAQTARERHEALDRYLRAAGYPLDRAEPTLRREVTTP